jgi:ketosteroid isomerase-like protein
MTHPEKGETEAVARRYFDAWTTRDIAAAASALANDFRFTAGDMTIEGRDAFFDAGAFPHDARSEMVAEAYQGEVAFQMYDSTRGDQTVRIVEQLSIRDGAIVSSTFVTDMAAFMALMGQVAQSDEPS